VPAEVTRARDQRYLLHEAAKRYAKPTTAGVSHIGGNYTARDFSLVGTAPHDPARTDIAAEPDDAFAGEVIEIELESILKANSVSRTRHRFLTKTRYKKRSIVWLQDTDAKVHQTCRRRTFGRSHAVELGDIEIDCGLDSIGSSSES
jgi:hypothetical protein